MRARNDKEEGVRAGVRACRRHPLEEAVEFGLLLFPAQLKDLMLINVMLSVFQFFHTFPNVTVSTQCEKFFSGGIGGGVGAAPAAKVCARSASFFFCLMFSLSVISHKEESHVFARARGSVTRLFNVTPPPPHPQTSEINHCSMQIAHLNLRLWQQWVRVLGLRSSRRSVGVQTYRQTDSRPP